MKRFDPVTLEVIRNRLDSIAAEIQATLLRSAYSVILKEGEDCSAALFNARGDVLAQSVALPQHMAAFIPAMARLLEAFPASACRAGDVYTMNDPHDGGTHLPDLVVAVPVFAAGPHRRLRGVPRPPGGFRRQGARQHADGCDRDLPGRAHPAAAEALRRGHPQRDPRGNHPPQRAAPAGGDGGHQRAGGGRHGRTGPLQALFEEYGTATDACLDGLLDYAERLTRARISEIPDGTYRFTDYMDNDGIALDRRVPITATVRIEGEAVTVDFTGTSPQVAGPINAPWSGGAGSAYFAVRCVTDPSIPNNQGCYRPIDVVIPEGTLLNPHHPAPVAIRAHTLKRAADVVLGALVQAVPDRVPAAPAGSISCVSFGGVDPRSGERFGLSDIVAGGSGGRPGGDGIEVVDTDVSNCMNIPAEAIEMDYPLRVRSYRLRRDSGGAGRYRGGTGTVRVLEAVRGAITCSYRSERHFTPAWGLFGGRPGAVWSTEVVRGSGEVETVPSKRAFTLADGDELRILSGGGGGHGPPLEREPRRVLADVLDGKVSAVAARSVYGVVLDIAARAVDEEATTGLRSRLRGENVREAAVWNRGFEHVEGAAPEPVDSHSTRLT